MADSTMDLDAALQAILDDSRSVADTETVRRAESGGRYLARPVDAPMSLPPFAASAMDGYALRHDDLAGEPPYQLDVTATSLAGHPWTEPTAVGGCVRIFTGAALPADLDTVVIQENCQRDGDRLTVLTPVAAADNVRPAGHDVAAGSRLFESRRRLSEFDVGWLTACGIDRVEVHRMPRVGIFSTGDELVDAPERPGPGQIFDANRMTVGALLGSLPVLIQDYGIVRDDRDAIVALLHRADEQCDVVITSGGVSVGDADWVKDAVADIGALQLWKLNLKPGKPVAYGRLRRAAFFGLPGNPVSAIVTALMLVRPALEKICGGEPQPPLTVPAILRGRLNHQPGREEFQRGTLTRGAQGLEVSVTGDQSSNRLASFAAANCLIRVAKGSQDLEQGAPVQTLPFQGAWPK